MEPEALFVSGLVESVFHMIKKFRSLKELLRYVEKTKREGIKLRLEGEKMTREIQRLRVKCTEIKLEKHKKQFMLNWKFD